MSARPFDLPRFLSSQALFGALGAPELERLAQASSLRRLSRGDIVFRAGEPCTEFHVVVLGQIKLFAISPKGMEKVVQLAGPGHSFGEAIMFLDLPYAVSAEVLCETLLVTIPKQAVFDEIEREPRFARLMLAALSRRIHSLMRDVQSNALQSGMERVIGYLLNTHEEGDDDIGHHPLVVALPVSKATIASRLSITPEYFSRVLHELDAAGLIRVDKRDIHIPNPKALAAYTPR